jgi:hypothetical protein
MHCTAPGSETAARRTVFTRVAPYWRWTLVFVSESDDDIEKPPV